MVEVLRNKEILERLITRRSDYSNASLLSYGSEGYVFKCDRPDGETIALKIINLDVHPEYVDKIQKEIDMHKTMYTDPRCPVVHMYNAKIFENYVFLEMEFNPGYELFDFVMSFKDYVETSKIYNISRCKKPGEHNICGLRSNVAYYIALKLFSALDCIHSKGIVHRDVKPENVMIERTDDQDDPFKAIFIDFGHSSTEDSPEEELRALRGTIIFMHPFVLDTTNTEDTTTGAPKEKLWDMLVTADVWGGLVTIFNVLTGFSLTTFERRAPGTNGVSKLNNALYYLTHTSPRRLRSQIMIHAEDRCATILLNAIEFMLTNKNVRVTAREILDMIQDDIVCQIAPPPHVPVALQPPPIRLPSRPVAGPIRLPSRPVVLPYGPLGPIVMGGHVPLVPKIDRPNMIDDYANF